MTTEQVIEFVPLLGFEESYEILNQFPFTIRNKVDHIVVKEYFNNDYLQVFLNKKIYLKHRLIALQFIPNPNNLPQVDHLNHNRADNRIENLRWVSATINQLNKSSNRGVVYEFVDDIPDEAIKVERYGGHEFENYYYYDNIFYLYNGVQYRKLYVNENKKGFKIVSVLDKNGERVRIYYSKFKKIYDLE